MVRRLGFRSALALGLAGGAIAWQIGCSDGGEPAAPGSDGSTGFIQISAATTGADLDPDGYTVMMDGRFGSSIGINGVTTLPDVPTGGHQVQLSARANNCSVAGDNPVNVSVTAGATAQVSFEVVCTAAAVWEGRIALLSDQGPFSDWGNPWYMYVMDDSVSNLTKVDPSDVEIPFPYRDGPQLSPDGIRIAFLSHGDIWLLDLDGSGLVNLTSHGEVHHSPAWSPDGSRIALDSWRDGNKGIDVMNADGSGAFRVSEGVGRPDWSPDGSRVAFETESGEIGAANADGSGFEILIDPPGGARHPRWSPDGSRVVFEMGSGEIGAVYADGSGFETLIALAGYATRPQWSPDGSEIAFLRELPSCSAPCVIAIADSAGEVTVEVHDFKDTEDFHLIFPFAWSPDGSKLAFSVRWFLLDRIYMINSDGTNLVPVTDDRANHIIGSWVR